jgi:hypothetical protein
MNFNLHMKTMRVYRSPMDIHTILTEPCSYPYNADNGVVFVQVKNGDMPTLKSPCAKFTPSDLANVFFHVQPITTIKTRIWRLSLWNDNHFELYRTISAPANFYVPPTGAIVAFRIRVNGERWFFEPTRIRVDKVTPSSKVTVNRFIRRYVPSEFLRRHHKNPKKTAAAGIAEGDEEGDEEGCVGDEDNEDNEIDANGNDASKLNAFA